MTKDEALLLAIKVLEGLCESFMPDDQWEGVEAHDITIDAIEACKDALKNPYLPPKNKQTKEPEYAYVWLYKENGSINLKYEFDSWAVMEEPFKYLGRIKLEVNND